MKYKVGDKVRVRNDLVGYERYGNQTFVPTMAEYTGEQIIKEIREEGYTIKADKHLCQYVWTDEMFDDIKEDKMDNNTLQINMNNLTDEERTTLLSLVEKANKPVNKVWKPEYNRDYYFIRNNGQICYTNWIKSDIDKERFILGNCFKTEKEAEFALEKLKVIIELKRYALEHNEKEIDWCQGTCKYYIQYDHMNNKLDIRYGRYRKNYNSSMYFTSEKIAQAAIKEIGEERIKKYYFEVND